MENKSYMVTGDWGFANITYSDKFLADLAARETLTWNEARELARSEFGFGGSTRWEKGSGSSFSDVPYSKRIAMGIVHKAKHLGVAYIKKG